MQISMSWLSEWVDIGTNAAALGNDLTLAGLEVSSIKANTSLHRKIVVGEKKSNSKNIKW